MHIKSTSVAILTSLAFAASVANAAETRDPVVPKFEIEFSANEVIGAEVTNHAGESVGEVHDILVTKEGAPISLVISVGGFLGIGDKLVAVQLHDIEFEEDGSLTLDATREELENRAPFDYENVSLVQLAPIGFGSIAATEAQDERARYLERWSNRLAAWEEKVEDSSRMSVQSAEDRIERAWQTVQDEWNDLRVSSARSWDRAVDSFESAVDAFESTWDDGSGKAGDSAAAGESQ